MKYGFAGDREISVKILELLISLGYRPSFLLVSENENATHTDKLIEISQLDSNCIFTNKDLKSKDFIEKIKKIEVDYIFGIHYPFIINKELKNFNEQINTEKEKVNNIEGKELKLEFKKVNNKWLIDKTEETIF